MAHPKQIAIIGGGPAGLMAAERLAAIGRAVTVYDRMPSPARKFLMAGRGGLNLTHSEPLDRFIMRYGAAADWLAPALRNFSPDNLRAWCEDLGQEPFIGSSGRVFPRAMKASPLLRAWLQRLDKRGVRFALRHDWLDWNGSSLSFQTPQGRIEIKPDATLLALGGASWPRLGADGGWVKLLQNEGVALAPLQPANCGFIVPWSDYLGARFAGHPLKNVKLSYSGQERIGEAMLTAQGLEGGAIYALSPRIREAIAQHGSAVLNLDLQPHQPLDRLSVKLAAPRGSQSLSSHLQRHANLQPVHVALLREVFSPTELAATTSAQLAGMIKNLPLRLTAASGMARAISSAGGVMRAALNEHFMLRAKPGVFVAGEMLDWEAPTGGYLLQGCFSTAVAAAHGIEQWLKI